MKERRVTLFVAILLAATAGLLQAPPAVAQSDVCNTTKQGTPITPALLTSDLPCQVEAVAPFTLDHLQDAFDFYSWLTFVALNSPASGGTIGKDAPAVWESWKNIFAVMVPPGQTPTPWGQPDPIPAKCQTVPHTEHEPVLRMVGKTPDLLTAVKQPFDTGPLIDQDGRYVHYEILINKSMFDFIVGNKLYSRAGQAAFTGKMDFEGGSDDPAAIGAIMVKAAWKVLGPSDDPDQFHTKTALLYQSAIANPPIAESCRAVRVGLVGLHIAHKTKAEPQWLWSTYEHVANAPSQADIDAKGLLKHYNFYNTACLPNKCAVNQPPPRPWNPDVEPFPGGYRSQVIRVIPIIPATVGLNAQFQALLKGTPWASYALISTQWPTDAASKTDPTGEPAPQFLANTTMETYIQGRVPISSSSCIACHNNATDTQGKFSDFTYILERAQ